MKGRRSERLAEEIREALAEIIGRELKDPRVGFVTVTRVSLASDLRHAKVMVGILGDEPSRARTLEGLGKAGGFVRRALGRRVRMHHVPELVFEYDRGLDASARVAELLEQNPPRDEED